MQMLEPFFSFALTIRKVMYHQHADERMNERENKGIVHIIDVKNVFKLVYIIFHKCIF